jgi:hypothetical protein
LSCRPSSVGVADVVLYVRDAGLFAPQSPLSHETIERSPIVAMVDVAVVPVPTFVPFMVGLAASVALVQTSTVIECQDAIPVPTDTVIDAEVATRAVQIAPHTWEAVASDVRRVYVFPRVSVGVFRVLAESSVTPLTTMIAPAGGVNDDVVRVVVLEAMLLRF